VLFCGPDTIFCGGPAVFVRYFVVCGVCGNVYFIEQNGKIRDLVEEGGAKQTFAQSVGEWG
jgi:hypothetical protein